MSAQELTSDWNNGTTAGEELSCEVPDSRLTNRTMVLAKKPTEVTLKMNRRALTPKPERLVLLGSNFSSFIMVKVSAGWWLSC